MRTSCHSLRRLIIFPHANSTPTWCTTKRDTKLYRPPCQTTYDFVMHIVSTTSLNPARIAA